MKVSALAPMFILNGPILSLVRNHTSCRQAKFEIPLF